MPAGTRIKLSIMMFLQFSIWGAWYVTMGTYLLKIGFDGISVGASYSTVNWGAIFAPIVAGMLADRFFSAQKVMAVLHLIGAAMLWWLSTVTNPTEFFWMLLAYAICYMPTLGLANAISFHQMHDPGVQFPAIRVMGTLGWIAVGLLIGMVAPAVLGHSIEDTNLPLKLGACFSLALGLFAFALPDTPPGNPGERPTLSQLFGLETIALMKDRSFAIFILGSLLISIPLSFYYNFANAFLNESGMENAAAKMTMGQMSEVIFLVLIPVFFVRLGVKKMLLVGMGAWVLRYLLFAFGNNDALVFMYYAGIILHGVCFDFFFVTGQIYVDKAVPKALRASAQGFIHVATYGAGMLIGSWASGVLVDNYTVEANGATSHLWQTIWIIPGVMAFVVMVLFMLFFKDPPNNLTARQ
ncbi:MAG: nucleoside permease [Gammaproteobacteria bacterium]|nr:nucleoside permease [Gammaproteobacteria bacterium]